MNQISVEDAQTWLLSGELNFSTVTGLLAEFNQQKTFPKVLNLCDVTRTDSAGLALLIELRKQTKDNPIIFKHIPEQMLNIATVSGVQSILMQAVE